ncbi:sensor histidine kinase [Faunimonas sp. B44]|uniref:sensor histidine kinase n=1 Tax=Faunimonas sp. B44 TaxID=3461493 RepID=UPI004044CDE5
MTARDPEETRQAAPGQAGGAAETRPLSGPRSRPTGFFSLSNKLLVLTILFVMVAEILIYIPSIANYRNSWLAEKLDTASLIAMIATSPAEPWLRIGLEKEMLAAVGLEAIAVRTHGERWLISASDAMPSEVTAEHDLTELMPLDSVRAAFGTLLSRGDGMILVQGPPPAGTERFEVVLREASLRAALAGYSRNILLLSLAISIITAALVYLALKTIIVRPIERLTGSMLVFSAAPDDAASLIVPSGRSDEIGIAEERLAEMQRALRDTLNQQRHLADLGLAVSKINHDLRNILASAQLFSDRLTAADDPLVKRFAPKIVAALDRAIGYTRSVLAYGQAREAPPERQLVSLCRLAEDVADVLALPGHAKITWENRLRPDVAVDADPDQLFRVVLNLCRNALDALDGRDNSSVIRRIWIEGERQGGVVTFRICDTGPGVPAKARAALFRAFQGSARPGGTGLGLAIAAEIVRAHGGEISLVEKGGAGAVFEIVIPDRPVDLRARLEARQRS